MAGCARATYYEYDAENRTESVTQGYGGSESQTVNYHYNEFGVIEQMHFLLRSKKQLTSAGKCIIA